MPHSHKVKINFCVRDKSACIRDTCDFEEIPVNSID